MRVLRRLILTAGIASLFVLGGCGSSDDFVFANQVPLPQPQPQPQPTTEPVVPPPVASADTFVSLGNSTLNQSAANGVLANDTPNGGSVVPFQGTLDTGGTLNLAADGSFTYTPFTGFVGSERFTYTVTNEGGSAEASVVIVVSDRGFFVNTAAGSNGDGSQGSPFNNIGDAFNAALPGDTVFVFGTSTVSGQVIVPFGVNLIGQGVGLVAAQSIVDPGTQPTLTGPVVPTSNNVITGFRIAGSASHGVDMRDRVVNQDQIGSNITVRSNLFENNTLQHIEMEQTFGPVFIEGNTFNEPSAGIDAVRYDFSGGDNIANLTINNNTFSASGANSVGRAIHIETPGSRIHQVTIQGNTITGANTSTSFSDGIRVRVQGAGKTTASISNNTISGIENAGLFMDGFEDGTMNNPGDADFSADIFNNNVSNCGTANLFFNYGGGDDLKAFNVFGNTFSSADDGIRVYQEGNSTLRVVASNNVISGNSNDGVSLYREGGAQGTFIFQANEFTNNGGDGVDGYSTNTDNSFYLFGFLNNVFTNSGGNDLLFTSENANSTNICFDIEANSFTSNVSLNPLSATTYTVEQFNAGLNTINTFLSGTVTTSGNPIVNAADGDCGIF